MFRLLFLRRAQPFEARWRRENSQHAFFSSCAPDECATLRSTQHGFDMRVAHQEGRIRLSRQFVPGERAGACSSPCKFPERGGGTGVRGCRTTASYPDLAGRERYATGRLVFIFSHISLGGCETKDVWTSLRSSGVTRHAGPAGLSKYQNPRPFPLVQTSAPRPVRDPAARISARLEKPLSREFLFRPAPHLLLSSGSGLCVAREPRYRGSPYRL
jgi:hypothetical protein